MNESNKENEIEQGLIRAIKNMMKYSLICEGKIVNTDEAETKFVCDVQMLTDGNPTYLQVPLKVLQGSQASFIEIPNMGSYCLISFRDGNKDRPQILFVDSVLKILVNCSSIKIETNSFIINSDSTIFNEGLNGGLTKVAELTQKLNNLEDNVNNLKDVFTGWTPVPSDGGAALKTAAATWAGDKLTKTEQAEIEDTTITH